MKMKLIALFFVLTSFNALMAQGRESEVLQKTHQYNKATFLDKDSLALTKLLSRDLTYGHSSGVVQNYKEMLAHSIHDRMLYPTFKEDQIRIKICGNTAWVREVISSKTIMDGQNGNLNLGILLIWVKQKGTWFLLARQAVKISVS